MRPSRWWFCNLSRYPCQFSGVYVIVCSLLFYFWSCDIPKSIQYVIDTCTRAVYTHIFYASFIGCILSSWSSEGLPLSGIGHRPFISGPNTMRARPRHRVLAWTGYHVPWPEAGKCLEPSSGMFDVCLSIKFHSPNNAGNILNLDMFVSLLHIVFVLTHHFLDMFEGHKILRQKNLRDTPPGDAYVFKAKTGCLLDIRWVHSPPTNSYYPNFLFK